jgi:transposase InsO family protein
VKFEFIFTEQAAFPIAFMCRQLHVSRSGYYAWRKRPESPRVRRDRELLPHVLHEFYSHPRGCGSRPVVAGLREGGHPVSRRRVVRLMAQAGLRHWLKRRYARTTNSAHSKPIARNRLKRRFDVGAPNRAWVADLTYIATRLGWVYLAVIIDLGSRCVVGWKVAPTMEQELVLGALRSAIERRRPAPGLIHHSDRGIQYAARAHRDLLKQHGILCSMSRKGDCWDNAVVESFFSAFRREALPDGLLEDWRHLDRLAFRYIEGFYNTRRRHSALGYVAPNEYERRLAA